MTDPMTAETQGRGFIVKRWNVDLGRYGEAVVLASTRGKALADAWRSDIFNGTSFGEFLKFARCTKSRQRPHRFGDPIVVLGRPAFFVDNNRQYVQFAYEGDARVLNAHPYDVEPEEYRPDTYRATALAKANTGREG